MIPKLLFDIAKCNNFCTLITHPSISNPCNEIIDFQRTQGAVKNNNFQIPEPWNGDIVNAPILIFSLNPAYSKAELYPTLAWPDPMIADFFMNRFKDRGIKYSWVYDNKPLNTDGTRGKSVRYWSSLKKRVEELLQRDANPGIDYCISEYVHCKSFEKIGVDMALPVCTKRFFGHPGISSAKIIIVIGSVARDYFKGKSNVNGTPVVYLPSPNAYEPKTFAKTHTEEEINTIRKTLSSKNKIQKSIEYSNVLLPTEKEIEEFIDEQITATMI